MLTERLTAMRRARLPIGCPSMRMFPAPGEMRPMIKAAHLRTGAAAGERFAMGEMLAAAIMAPTPGDAGRTMVVSPEP